ncbi:MAG: class I SAM-dependent methyltransferase [Bacteroidota bacterium]
MNCRHCKRPLEHVFLDLGFAPPSNAYLDKADLNKPEVYYPLRLKVCTYCWLVQTEDFAKAEELFSPEYAYFSSTSTSWLAHARSYTEKIIPLLQLNRSSFVVELASNDGYLLKNFVSAGIPCMGIEPTDSTANASEAAGIPTLRRFFGNELAFQLRKEEKQADLIIGNNVYAHVPDVNDFTLGLKTLLKTGGTITLEFPHLLQLLEQQQFDTVYHEHYSYFSLYTVSKIFTEAGLRIYDVEQLDTHGGSLRIYGCHDDDFRPTCDSVIELLSLETAKGLQVPVTYEAFQEKADTIKNGLLEFLIAQKKKGKKVAAYGAAAKGNTLLNYAGVKTDLIAFVCDAAPSKQNKYLPGSHIPVLHAKALKEFKPDWLLILPWNISKEVESITSFINEWGGHHITAVPAINIL